MVNKPKQIGTAAETAVVRYLAKNGFPNAERRALRGSLDCGDLTGLGPVCVEVKGGKTAKEASDGLIASWLVETETERVNAKADVAFLVIQRAGIGPDNAGRWWAVMEADDYATLAAPASDYYHAPKSAPVRMHLADMVRTLRNAGHGDVNPPWFS